MSNLLRFMLATSLVILLSFCGGGTHGSGGQLYDGSVSDSSGRALQGVTVTLVTTGDSSVTNELGLFSFETDEQVGEVTFLLEDSEFSVQSIQTIPEDSTKLFIEFKVKKGQRPEVDSRLEVREKRPKRPTPTPTTTSNENNPDRDPTPSGGPGDDDGGNPGPGGRPDDDSPENDATPTDDHPDSEETPDDDDNSGPGGGGEDRPTPAASPTRTPTSGGEERVEAEGQISGISSSAVTVRSETFKPVSSTEYRGKNGSRLSLGDFSVGDVVKARGLRRNGTLELERLEKR